MARNPLVVECPRCYARPLARCLDLRYVLCEVIPEKALPHRERSQKARKG